MQQRVSNILDEIDVICVTNLIYFILFKFSVRPQSRRLTCAVRQHASSQLVGSFMNSCTVPPLEELAAAAAEIEVRQLAAGRILAAVKRSIFKYSKSNHCRALCFVDITIRTKRILLTVLARALHVAFAYRL